jgi:serine/threonine protein kinase
LIFPDILAFEHPLPSKNQPPAKLVEMQQKSNEKGVFNGYVGDGVDMSKQFPQGRYTISSKLGAGTYGKVLACIDKKYNLPVAIKIVRKDPPIYKEAAVKEIAVLRHLGGTHGCLRLLRDFQHDGHLCISMEMYGENLQAYMKRKGKPFDLTSVRDIGLQLAHACEYMHSKSIIHTDIKSENILLAAGQDGMFTIKLVDMGSSLFMSWWHPPIIGTMEYRAPETLLQAGWSCPVDNFASGCVLAELGSGKYLLPGVREEEHLKAIEVVMEQRIPQNLMHEGRKNMCKYNANLIVQSGSQYTIPDVPLQVKQSHISSRYEELIRSVSFVCLSADSKH